MKKIFDFFNRISIQSPSFVRLGDQNLALSNDGAQPVEYDIKTFIKHANFKRDSKENDIALIELRKDVEFTKFIRPACLQQDNNFANPLVAVNISFFKIMNLNADQILLILQTGWGQIATYNRETSKELLKVSLNKVDMASCNDTHDGDLFETQFCAGGKAGKVRKKIVFRLFFS